MAIQTHLTNGDRAEGADDPGTRLPALSMVWGDVWRRSLRLLPVMLWLFLPAGGLLVGIVVLRLVAGVPMAEFTRDPAQTLGQTPFIGAISDLGILLWAAAATACLLAGGLLGPRHRARGYPGFLFLAGALTVALMLDDLFLFHDVVFPEYLGVSEHVLYAFYGLAAVSLLVEYRRLIAQSDYPLLLLALGLFGISLVMDFVSDYVLLPGMFMLEDGPKFLGIVAWAGYFIRTSALALREAMAD